MREPNFITIPAGCRESFCKSCHKPGYWIRTALGKAMLVDPAVPGGDVPSASHEGRGFAHFATCPHADSHRRRSPVESRAPSGLETPAKPEVVHPPSMFETPADVVAAAELVAKHSDE